MSALRALVHDWERAACRSNVPRPYIIIQLVTILEVFTREWVAQIIDAGGCYTSRAADLVKGALKIDFVMAQALVGKQVTFGELISHDISVNGIADIDAIFSRLLDKPIFSHLGTRVDVWPYDTDSSERLIMPDPVSTKAELAQLFETRHILVHELPLAHDLPEETVSKYLQAAYGFVRAANDAFLALMYGESVMVQNAAQVEASLKAEAASDELINLLAKVDPDHEDERLQAVQAAWERYSRLQAGYRSGVDLPDRGSLSPIIYATEMERLTRKRIEEVEWFINKRDGDL